MFSAPIPGQSLTSEPKNSSWENPPEITEPEEALLWHLEQFDKPKKVEAVAGLVGLGLDIVTMTEGLLRSAVAEGRHSIDVSLIIAPVIHEFLKGLADATGMDYDEGLEDDDSNIDLETIRLSLREEEAAEVLKEIKAGGKPNLSTLKIAEAPMEEEPMPDMELPQEKTMGLMTRRTA
tara:strand:- start:212 stop:745 length:534 start_codon:yes stop_codon:yes gene_type:complete